MAFKSKRRTRRRLPDDHALFSKLSVACKPIMSGNYSDFGYTAPGPGNANVGQQLAERFVDLARRLNGVEYALDLGCGNGYLGSRLGASGLRITGVDTSESGIAIANQNYATDKVRYVRAEIGPDLVNLLTAEHRFDLVISSDVIEHLYRPAALIDTAASLLRPGGYLIVGTPYHGYLKNLAISVLNEWDAHHGVHWDGGHIKFFSERTLRALVVQHGFKQARFHFYGRMPWLWKHMICVAQRDT